MGVMWLVDGDFLRLRQTEAERQHREDEEIEEEGALLRQRHAQQLALDTDRVEPLVAQAGESATLTPQAKQYLAGFPLPPPNSEIAAQPRADLDHRLGYGQRGIDPVNALEASARTQSYRDDEAHSPTTVGQLMSRDPQTVTASESAKDALEKLQKMGCHHLPVVDSQQRLVGLVSDRDLLGRESLLEERMITRVLTASPTTGLEEAAQAMAQERFHSLVVVDQQQRPVGMLTSFDLMKFLVKHPAMKLWHSHSQTSTGA